MAAEIKGIRIGEIAKRAGVPVSTVKHYYREGLLPEPLIKRRNSAYYSEDAVERVRLIKRLQEQAFLPLKIVKDLFRRTTDPQEIRRYLPGRRGFATAPERGHTPREQFLESGVMSVQELDKLAELGLVSPVATDDGPAYNAYDAKVITVLVRMRKLGLTPERGFGAERLQAYQKHLQALVRMEVTMALEGMVGRMSPEELQNVAGDILDSATDLVAALHRKELARVLGEQSQP